MSLAEIRTAIGTADDEEVAGLCQDLIRQLNEAAEAPGLDEAVAVLKQLQNRRLYSEACRVAEAMWQNGQSAAPLRRRYAQAMIERGLLTPALHVLEALAREVSAPEHPHHGEYAEARGLIGRVYKQMYVNAHNPGSPLRQQYLREALLAYHTIYRENASAFTWHGINTVALLARAVRDQVAISGFPASHELAQEILSTIEAKPLGNSESWDYGTAAEACAALYDAWLKPEHLGEARKWMKLFVAIADNKFTIASTLRQLEEVWRFTDEAEPGKSLIPLLRGEVLRSVPTGKQSLAQSAATYEKVFGADSFVSLKWFRDGLEQGRSIARIGKETDRGLGTGFLLRGSEINPAWGDDPVLLTNAHVIGHNEQEWNASPPSLHHDEVMITFEASDTEVYRAKEVLWSSPRTELDATFVRLDRPAPQTTGYKIAKRLPSKTDQQRVYIIGHPGGGALSFSIQDNLLLDYENDGYRLHYRTPTEGGSSGSPVFNQQWQLIALHHAGGEKMAKLNGAAGAYEANEGIWIQAIIKAIREQAG